jgi:hypothetical protein
MLVSRSSKGESAIGTAELKTGQGARGTIRPSTSKSMPTSGFEDRSSLDANGK